MDVDQHFIKGHGRQRQHFSDDGRHIDKISREDVIQVAHLVNAASGTVIEMDDPTINEDWRRCGGVRLIIEALVRFITHGFYIVADRNPEVLVCVDLVHRLAIRPVENEAVAHRITMSVIGPGRDCLPRPVAKT